MLPTIPVKALITTDMLYRHPRYSNVAIVRIQSNPEERENFTQNRYQFQHEPSKRTPIRVLLCLKGVVDSEQNLPRVTATAHLSLQEFVDLVKYDPSDPPPDNYHASVMSDLHVKTQSDFKGAKKKNKSDFSQYLVEGITDQRQVYLPTVSGWQTNSDFADTIFVAFDEDNPNCMYGTLYLPKKPIMQSDGQTQTAALFSVANSKDAVQANALERLQVSLEIELNMDAGGAGQSFADRNGRGSKKNKNLVIGLDNSSALSRLRIESIAGTVFENRIADGRNGGISITSTANVLNLSTMEQVLLSIIAGEKAIKPERFKHAHVDAFLPYAIEFFQLMDTLFAAKWKAAPDKNEDTYRRLYTHGWAFTQKAIARAYHMARIDELGPLYQSIGAKSGGATTLEAFNQAVTHAKLSSTSTPPITLDELKSRLQQIDWRRYRAHWIKLTTCGLDKTGKKRIFTLKDGTKQVVAKATNTNATINAVTSLILSKGWTKLTKTVDEPLV